MRHLLLLYTLLVGGLALGQATPPVVEPRDCRFFVAEAASADIESDGASAFGKPFSLSKMARGSFDLTWAGLTGTLDGAIKLQVASTASPPGANDWSDKAGASFVIDSADGKEVISVTNITESWGRVVYTHNNVSGGAITGFCHLKGG